jgi:hypothetical protein
MTRSNEWIKANINGRLLLTEVARGSLHPENESPLFLSMLRNVAATMIHPLVLQEAVAAAGVSSDVLGGSGVIFELCTGFGTNPEHLTEEQALKEEEEEKKHAGNNNRILGKRVRIQNEGKEMEVEINREVSVNWKMKDPSERESQEWKQCQQMEP